MKKPSSRAASGKASTTKTTFSRETAVTIDIQSDVSIIWALLTNAADYPRWNSTIVSIEGNIVVGETIKLIAKIAPKRTFKIKIQELVPEKSMIWGDGQGKRTYTLDQINDQTIRFSMHEKIGGFLFPLYGRMIPSFDEAFETYAADLKNEAESIQNSKN